MERKWEWIANRLHEIKKAYIVYQFDGIERLTEYEKEMREKSKKILESCYVCKKIAKQFDEFLNETYEIEYTLEWEEDYEDFDVHISNDYTTHQMLDRIYDIAHEGGYCTACFEESDCAVCKFGLKFGFCDGESLFRDFSVNLEELEERMREL
jgi:hypothetical protein